MNSFLNVALMMLVSGGLIMVETEVFGQPKETRDQKVLRDRKEALESGKWIYNDIDAGFAEAKKTGKPMLIVFRCIPCEQCVKLDEDLMEQDPILQELMTRFVLVRRVYANGLDMQKFQYDTDQSFAVMMFNGDGTIYGRYGTRSARQEWEDDVSIEGLAAAMEGTLELHKKYAQVKATLKDKQGVKKPVAQPEMYPSLKASYTDSPDYAGQVVKTCIHCHMMGDAEKEYYRTRKEPMPTEILFPYPHPKAVGIILDPHTRGDIKEIKAGSLAEKSGLKAKDEIVEMNGQPILSMADVQWVFQGISNDGGKVDTVVRRNGKNEHVSLNLTKGWREMDDISWRVGSWTFRRMSLGGMKMIPLTDEEKKQLPPMAKNAQLKVERVGQYNKHRLAKDKGFMEKDIIISWDNKTSFKSETDLLVYGVTAKKMGDVVNVDVLRNGKKVSLKLPMQD